MGGGEEDSRSSYGLETGWRTGNRERVKMFTMERGEKQWVPRLVLGPELFKLSINDLALGISSDVTKSVDDDKLRWWFANSNMATLVQFMLHGSYSCGLQNLTSPFGTRRCSLHIAAEPKCSTAAKHTPPRVDVSSMQGSMAPCSISLWIKCNVPTLLCK